MFSKSLYYLNWLRRITAIWLVGLLMLGFSITQVFADQLVAAEYFVNTDPGAGNATAISATVDGSFDASLENISFDLSADSYSEGTHTIYIRFKSDNGRWGPARGLTFRIDNRADITFTVSGAEYFIDTDPGEGNGTPISSASDGAFDGSQESFSTDVTLNSLAEGRHTIYTRFQKSNGQWGEPKGFPFTVSTDENGEKFIAGAEYFFNTDPGPGNGTQIASAADGSFDGMFESINIDAGVDGLAEGPNILYTRFKGNNGEWGQKRGLTFNVSTAQAQDLTIQGAEYFIDEDPGAGNGTSIDAPVDGTFDGHLEELEATFNVSGLSLGRHYAYFRVQASNGQWGPARGVPFQVEEITIVQKAEYYFDTDPGEGNGTPITVSRDGSFNSVEEQIEEEISISDAGLDIGRHTVYVRFQNNKGEWSQASSKNFTVQTKPVITVSADTLNFGEHVVGDSTALSFNVGNDGDGELDITNITSSSNEFSVEPTSGSIPANSSDQITFTVSYEPTSAGSKNVTLTIANNDQNQTIRLLGSALAREPVMEISATSLDYGEVIVGDSVAQTVAIRNSGYDTLKIDQAAINSDEFSAYPKSGVLEPRSHLSDSLVLVVSMIPNSEGTKNASLTIGGNVASQQVSLTGEAKINPQPTIAVSTDSLAFDAIEMETDSTRNLEIRNLGSNTLTISSFSVSGEGFSANIDTPQDIERGSPVTVPVTFSPTISTSYTGSITIQSNDSETPSLEVKLSGEGTTGPPTKLLATTPQALDFGLVTRDDTTSQVLTLENDGNATLKISVMSFNNSSFFVESPPSPSKPLFVDPESSKDVMIQFSPNVGGNTDITGVLSIGSDRTDSDDAVTVDLSGTGVDQPTPNVVLSTRRLDFGELRLGETNTLSLTLTNGGNADLVVNNVSINNTAFELNPPLSVPFTLQPDDQQPVSVRFEPAEVNSYAASLTISSNIDPATVELIGEGVTLSAGVDSVDARSGDNSTEKGSDYGVSIQPTGLGSSGSAFIYYKAGGAGPVSSNTKEEMQSTTGGSFSASIPSQLITERGVSYWYEVSDGTETVTSPASEPHLNPYTIIVETPEGITRTTPQPAGAEQNFYRMVSVPLDNISGDVSAVLENFGEADPESWRLFRWQTGRYVEHSESDFEPFAPGRAYWFITTQANSLKSGSGQSARTDEPFSIFLQPGWNMVGSPFNFSIDWGAAEKSADVGNLFSYDGSSFLNSNNLEPWAGYFVFNQSTNPTEVKLHPVESTGSSEMRKALAGSSSEMQLSFDSEKSWFFQLGAESGIIGDRYNIAGIHPNASDEADQLDQVDAPRQPGEFLKLYLEAGSGNFPMSQLAVDLRSPTIDGHFWDFSVNSNSSADRIRFEMKQFGKLPDGMKAWLLDKDQQSLKAVDLESGKLSFGFRSGLGDTLSRDFRLVVGTQAFLASHNLGISEKPNEFVLKQNYPNPFNPSTTIAYGLPEASQVKIEVYNTLGRRIAVVLDQPVQAGYHDVIWHGEAYSSGVYFYRLVARGSKTGEVFTKIQKMTLIK